MKITLFCEEQSPKNLDACAAAYPDGMQNCIADIAREAGHDVKIIMQTNAAGDDGSALTEDILRDTDVLLWWGHRMHGKVSDEVVSRVVDYVNRGMGFVPLHSAHESKPFQRLVGTTGSLSWRESGDRERLWIINAAHPIVRGIDGEYFELKHEEMYGEPFNIPTPDELIFISWFTGGEVMRSGCVFRRGYGKIFYFRPGHETFPTYFDANVRRVIQNGIEYVAPSAPICAEPVRSVHHKIAPESSN